MFACALALSTFAFIPSAFAWGNLTGLLQALNSSGLDQFANATASLNDTATGRYVLAQLSQGNNTIFAPTDNAWSSANFSNETSLADIVSYHIVPGNIVNETATYPNETIAHTLLNDSSLVMLEGNQSQVLAWSKFENGSFFVVNQGSNVTVSNTTSYNNTAILAVDSVLTPPSNISTILKDPRYNLTLLASLLQSTTFPNDSSILDALDSAHGVTLFAPNNAALQAAQGSLAGLAKNITAFFNVVSNHIINGTSVYTTEMSSGSTYTSAGGEEYAFVSNSTGHSVSVGGTNEVGIVVPNVLASNGVVQVVDGVLFDANSNATAASLAFASATSVAAQTTQTGIVTAASISTSATTSSLTFTHTSTPTSTPTSKGTGKSGANNWKAMGLLGMIVGLGQII